METPQDRLAYTGYDDLMTNSRPEDFCLDTLAALHRRNITFRGLKPYEIIVYLDGAVDVWFEGIGKTGQPEHKKISLICDAGIKNAAATGQPEVIAEVIEQLIDHNSARFF